MHIHHTDVPTRLQSYIRVSNTETPTDPRSIAVDIPIPVVKITQLGQKRGWGPKGFFQTTETHTARILVS
jgi:hypothetical protein